MTDDEKIDFLKDLSMDLGPPMQKEVSAKSMKRELQDFLAGFFYVFGVLLHVFCGYLSYRSGVFWWLIAGIVAFPLLTLIGNRIARLSTLTSGEAGISTAVLYALMYFLMMKIIFFVIAALFMREWVLVGYFAIPAVVFWRLERDQSATAEPDASGQRR